LPFRCVIAESIRTVRTRFIAASTCPANEPLDEFDARALPPLLHAASTTTIAALAMTWQRLTIASPERRRLAVTAHGRGPRDRDLQAPSVATVLTMRWRWTIPATALVLLAAGCSSSNSGRHTVRDPAGPIPIARPSCASEKLTSEPGYVGLRIAKARHLAAERGQTIRVAQLDDGPQSFTADRRPNRLDVWTQDGRIVQACRE
jgi:hypothetical protein